MSKIEFNIDFDNMLASELPTTYDLLMRNNAMDSNKKNKMIEIIRGVLFEETSFVLSSIWGKESEFPVIILQIGFEEHYPRMNMKGEYDIKKEKELHSINLTRNSFSINIQKMLIEMFLMKNLKAIIAKPNSNRHIIIALKSGDKVLNITKIDDKIKIPTTEVTIKVIEDTEFKKLKELYQKLNGYSNTKTISFDPKCGCKIKN